MPGKIVIVNAFEPEDFFIRSLSQEYDNTIAANGMMSELLFVSTMYFSFSPFPQQFNFETLENDLQKCVTAIKAASTLVFFTSYKPDRLNPAFSQFVSRLFHLDAGNINKGIWGNINVYNQKVRIITVIDDEESWKRYNRQRLPLPLPINKVNFKLFGFGAVYSSTFGYLQNNQLNDYGIKCLKTIAELAKKDCV
ncbi:MAG: hypothetical protein QM726_23105 [Chitinophagaceae bacterium]